jgi:hypothetical protein
MAEEGGPKIFISHASGDPDWPDLAVEAIADKLRQRGAQVWLDLWHEREVVLHKLPLAEWRQWMGRCLDEADHVLCLCSTRYAMLAHRGDQEEPAGRGVACESFEIEKRIYKQKQHNKDWVWLLRLEDAPSGAVVPEFLEDRCPEYSTPSEDTRLVNELVGNRLTKGRVERPVGETQAEPCFSAETDALRDQCSLAQDRLKQSPALWSALRADAWEGNRPAALGAESAFAAWLARADSTEAENAMFAVRRALATIQSGEDIRRPAELATVAVYGLAACRLVDRSAVESATRFPTHISHAAHLYCAVVATVLFGGRLEFAPSNQPGLPRTPNAHEIRVPAAGDHRSQAFEHAVFQALFAADPRTPEVALDAGELTETQRAQIRRRIQTVRRKQQQTLTLVVHADALYPPADAFAKSYAVPVFVCDRDIADALLGMSAEDLVADIQEMWSELHFCNRPGSNAAPDQRNSDARAT